VEHQHTDVHYNTAAKRTSSTTKEDTTVIRGAEDTQTRSRPQLQVGDAELDARYHTPQHHGAQREHDVLQHHILGQGARQQRAERRSTEDDGFDVGRDESHV
jgi:hypothetical protein